VGAEVHAQRDDPQQGGDPAPLAESLARLDPDAHGHGADGAGDRGQYQVARERGEDRVAMAVLLEELGELDYADDGEDEWQPEVGADTAATLIRGLRAALC
jgi:hypothetical protein